MPIKNNTSDLIDCVVYSADLAAGAVIFFVIVFHFAGPVVAKVLRAAVIDPAVRQWNAPIAKSAYPNGAGGNIFFSKTKNPN